MSDEEDNEIITAYRQTLDDRKRVEAAKFICRDLSTILCVILRGQDSCLEYMKARRSIPA